MKLPLFISVALGLLAGVVAGVWFSTTAREDAQLTASHPASTQTLTTGNSKAAISRPDDDGRIARVLGAIYQPVRLRQRAELYEALQAVGANELPELIKRARLLPSDTSEGIMKALVERWFEVDLVAAKAWVRSQHDQHEYFEGWARANPENALSEGLAWKNYWADTLVSEALNAMYGERLTEKLAKARGLAPGALRDSVIQGVIVELAKQDPAAALDAVSEITSVRYRESSRDAILRIWAEHDPKAALAKMDEIIPTLKAGVLGSVLVTNVAERVAAKDPRLALEWLKGIPAELGAIPSIAAAREWAEKEPIPALSWCLQNGVDPARVRPRGVDSWQGGVLAEAMTRAPLETVALVEALPPGPERDRLLECTFKESLWHTPLDQLFDGESPLAWRLFDQLPADAQAASSDHLGQKRGEKGDLTDLAGWANMFVRGPVRTHAVASAVTAVYRRDAAQADELLTTVTGSDRDAALGGLARAMSDRAPKEAATRALAIADATQRQDALSSVIVPWLVKDPTSGRAWMEGAGAIPATWKTEWIRFAEEAGNAGRR